MSTATETRAETRKISSTEYHAAAEIGSTMLKLFRQSPAKFHRRYILGIDEHVPTESMLLGSLVHSLVFEPGTVPDLYATAPKCDRRTTAGKADWAEFCAVSLGKSVVTADTMATAEAIAESVRQDTWAKLLLGLEGEAEQSIYWTDEPTGIACKARLDWACQKSGTVVDLKTCGDASPEGFSRQMARFDYHCQAAWYCDAWKALTGTMPTFVFIAVETEAPYEVACHEISEESLELGRQQNTAALAELAECRKTGDYEAKWRQQINRLSLPRWSFASDYTL